jgi:hypothetical protein
MTIIGDKNIVNKHILYDKIIVGINKNATEY